MCCLLPHSPQRTALLERLEIERNRLRTRKAELEADPVIQKMLADKGYQNADRSYEYPPAGYEYIQNSHDLGAINELAEAAESGFDTWCWYPSQVRWRLIQRRLDFSPDEDKWWAAPANSQVGMDLIDSLCGWSGFLLCHRVWWTVLVRRCRSFMGTSRGE